MLLIPLKIIIKIIIIIIIIIIIKCYNSYNQCCI